MDTKVNLEETSRCSILGCDFKASSEALNKHIFEKHSVHMFSVISQLQTELQKKNQELEEQQEKLKSLENKLKKMSRSVDRRRTRELSNTTPLLQIRDPKIYNMETVADKMEDDLVRLKGTLRSHSESLDQCSNAVEQVEERAYNHAICNVKMRSRQIRMKSHLNYGVFVWRITGIDEHIKSDNGSIQKLCSDTFYSTPQGYRISLCAHLCGEGTVETTHISLFFVLLPSINDDFLHWPFAQPVTLTLINQDPSKSTSKTLHPDGNSASFAKPNKEANLPSGFPRFAPASVLTDEGFVKDNTLMIMFGTSMDGENVE